VRVPEDVSPGTAVARVRARDRDLGLNGHVRYVFSPLTEAQHGALLGIKPDTGKIYVKAPGLDHEQAAVSIVSSLHFTHTPPSICITTSLNFKQKPVRFSYWRRWCSCFDKGIKLRLTYNVM